jgi:hypothetical protein
MSGASLAVQKLLTAALRADNEISVLVSGVFDFVPVQAAYPYITLGPDLASDWSSKTNRGHEHRVLMSVWDAPGSSARAKQLLAAIEDAVCGMAGSVENQRIVNVLFLRSFVTKDPDGATQGVIEFRIRSEQIEGN